VSYFLGIDGGGTKTRCAVGDEKSVLATGTSTSCKVQRVGEACAHDALAAAIHEACVQAGVSPSQITRTCAGVTGAGRPEIANALRRLIGSVVSGDIEVVGDVDVAFEDAFGSGPGVLVIAGTGSIAYGRNAAGETARAGGWGHTVSDEGSGYWIGREAVKAALRQHDAQRCSALLSELMVALGLNEFDDFIVRINDDPPPDYAALFPVAQHSADEGDKVALAVLEHAAKELAHLTQGLILKLFREKTPVEMAIYGGVFTASNQLRESFSRTVRGLLPHTWFSSKVVDAARGALSHARNDRTIS
jgi:glucosamine kinase